MSIQNPIIANKVWVLEPGSASNPDVSFGGSLRNGANSGTGIYSDANGFVKCSSSGLNSMSVGPAGSDLKLSNDVAIIEGAGVPVDGTTGATFAGPGSLYIDITNKNAYINANTKASPTWKLITRAA